MLYKAFISYSHAADGKLAPALQSGLRRFARPWYRLHAIRIFRDQTNLSINPGLWSSIETALSNSEFFVLLASPQAAASKWVAREVDYWLKNKTADKLLIVLTDGQIMWDSADGDFNWTKTDCLPVNLSKVFKEEPLHLDFRWARTAEDLSLKNITFIDKIADLVATLRGRSKDELIGEDVRQHRKAKRLASSAVVMLLMLTVFSGIQAYLAIQRGNLAESRRIEAEQQRRLATEKQNQAEKAAEAEKKAREEEENQRQLAEQRRSVALARQLAAQAELTLNQQADLLGRSVLLAVESLKRMPSLEANRALRRTSSLLIQPVWSSRSGNPVSRVAISPDSRYVAIINESNASSQVPDESHSVRLRELLTGKEVISLKHANTIWDVAFSPQGRFLATGSRDFTARVWEVNSGLEVARIAHNDTVYGVTFSNDGKWLATASFDRTAQVWEWASGKRIARLPHPWPIRVVTFSPDGRYLATTGGKVYYGDEEVRLWDLKNQRLVVAVNHKTAVQRSPIDPDRRTISTEDRVVVNDVVFSPDGNHFATAGFDASARIWNLKGEMIATLTHNDSVESLVFAPDGRYLATASADSTVRLWDPQTGREIVRMSHERGVEVVAFSPDGHHLATASFDQTARLWEVPTGREIGRVIHEGIVQDVTFDSSGRYLATGSADNIAGVWDIQSLRKVTYDYSGVSEAAFSRDGRFLAAVSQEKILWIWETITGKILARVPQRSFVRALAFSNDARFVATATDPPENVAGVWEVMSGKEVAQLTPRDKEALRRTLAFSPNGQYLAISSGDRAAEIWSLGTGERFKRLLHDGRVLLVAFSPNGRELATAAVSPDHNARIWDVSTGKEIRRFRHEGSVYSLSFSPDGQYLATGSEDRTARVWDLASGKELIRMQHRGAVHNISFSPDRRRIATAARERTARIWNVKDGREMARITHDNEIQDVNFSPDGSYLATSSSDYTARVWEVETGQEVARINHRATVRTVAFSPDGRYVLSGSNDGNVQVWLWRAPDLVKEACNRLTRNLTQEEWRQFLGDEAYSDTCAKFPTLLK